MGSVNLLKRNLTDHVVDVVFCPGLGSRLLAAIRSDGSVTICGEKATILELIIEYEQRVTMV
jgi:predicted Fe-Mo cluster-binding NifX family protein